KERPRDSRPAAVLVSHDSYEYARGSFTAIVSSSRVPQDISREFPRALDVGAHAGHVYRAICAKVRQ
ncbi:unnamed protein product, partial [Laminaria digitata]